MPIDKTIASIILTLAVLVSRVSTNELSTWDIRLDTTDTKYGPLTTIFTPPASCFTTHTTVRYGYPSLIQGCKGPYGDTCCPQGWNYHAYFSPGRCPSGYRGCTLPTSTQREETTNICCPNGFECAGQDYCVKSFNTPSTITYTDSTLSTQQTVYGITASPIQIRFKAFQSNIVPVPTDSLKLPKEQRPLDKRAKAGIGIGVFAGIVLLGACVFFAMRHYRRRKASVEPSQPARNIGNGISSEDYYGRMGVAGEGEPDGDLDPPPAYTGPMNNRK